MKVVKGRVPYICFIVSLHSYLVVSVLGNVSNPRQGLVATLLHDLEVSHLDATDGEVGDLKLELDRNVGVFLPLLVLNRWEPKCGSHHVLFPPRELLDAPDHATLVRHVLYSTHIGLENGTVNVDWNRDDNLNIVGDRFLLELSPHFDHIFNL